MEIPASPLDASLFPDFDFELISDEMLTGAAALFQSPEYSEPFNHHPDASISFFDSSLSSSASEIATVTNVTQEDHQRESEPSLFDSQSFVSESSGYPIKISASSNQNRSVAGVSALEDRVSLSKLLIRRGPTHVPSLNQRLMHALRCIKENSSEGDLLVQIWVPTKRGGAHVLTTCGQPFAINSHSRRLMNYRTVSLNYFFPAEVEAGSEEVVGLPGRVFNWQLPEWTPDAQYYSKKEYARVAHAHRYGVHGTLAVPVFERDSRLCLGVLEVVTTIQKIKFASEVDNICAALQACNNEYRATIPEILEVLKVVCETHKLPLALTWISCIQQGKMGSRHSDDNYKNCVSTLDAACYARDPHFCGFQEACSEHHLLKGEGIAGMAFTTNQPCFSADVTVMSREDYPMLHHAKLFGLRAAIAIRLRSIYTGIVDYILEFFLPVNCIDTEEQRLMLNSLSLALQRVLQGLRVVTDEDIECEARLQVTSPDLAAPSSSGMGEMERISDAEVLDRNQFPESKRSRTDNVPQTTMGGRHIDRPAYIPLEIQSPENETSNTVSSLNHNQLRLDDSQKHDPDSETNYVDIQNSSMGDATLSEIKANERRRFKSEKTISLEVLQQYFAGSLKDAAKSIGACPTTLKRICRQYGIARWPSRKIKKVDHSIKKLQLVIDSVQGVGGTLKFSSFYDNLSKGYGSTMTSNSSFGKLSAETFVRRETPNVKPADTCGLHVSSKSSSSCSQGSSSGHSCPSEEKCKAENVNSMMEGEQGELVLPAFNLVESAPIRRSHGHKHPSEQPLIIYPPSMQKSSNTSQDNSLIRVKVAFGEEIIRFKVQPTIGFHDLREEIAKRFHVKDVDAFELKSLDDDSEWVTLNRDEDLRECVDIYRSSNARVIKLTFHRSSPLGS